MVTTKTFIRFIFIIIFITIIIIIKIIIIIAITIVMIMMIIIHINIMIEMIIIIINVTLKSSSSSDIIIIIIIIHITIDQYNHHHHYYCLLVNHFSLPIKIQLNNLYIFNSDTNLQTSSPKNIIHWSISNFCSNHKFTIPLCFSSKVTSRTTCRFQGDPHKICCSFIALFPRLASV